MKDKKIVYQESNQQVVVDENGSFKKVIVENKKQYKIESEPEYVKLYLDSLGQFKGWQLGLNPILLEMLRRASYADSDLGGQVIYLNKILKEQIGKKCNVGYKRVEQAITSFVKAGAIRRIGVGTYQFNPYLFGKGEWKDIKNIRAAFDFGTGEVIADIVKEEEKAMSENQSKLEKNFVSAQNQIIDKLRNV